MKNLKAENKTILVFAPHPDDEVLGVGGTIIKNIKEGNDVVVCIATTQKKNKHRIREAYEANEFMGVKEVCFLDFEDLYLEKVPREKLNKKVLEVIEKYKPYEVYTPHEADLHPDHRTLTEAVMVAIRPKYKFSPSFAFTYETLSETGWNYNEPSNGFSPNVYVNITNEINEKLDALKKYETQIFDYPNCRSIKSVEALAMYRGTQAEMEYAEAFKLIRGYKNE